MKTPFVVLFQERSGSTHLSSLLSSHPEVNCRAEDFSFDWYRPTVAAAGDGEGSGPPTSRRKLIGFRERVLDPTRAQIEGHLAEIFESGSGANGFKLKHPNQTARYPEVLQYLEALGDRLRVVHLDRENVIKRAVSKQVLVRMRQGREAAHLRNENLMRELEFQPIRIDVPEAVRYAGTVERLRTELAALVDRFPHVHRVEYDDLARRPHEVVPDLLGFLGVDPAVPLSTGVHKATPDALSDAVENFEELAVAVNDTGMAHHLGG